MRILKTCTYNFTHQASNLKQFICKTSSNLRKTAHSEVRKDSVHELSGPSSRSICQFSWQEATKNITSPPYMGCHSIETATPCISSGCLIFHWYPLLLGVERGTGRVKCFAQEYYTVTRPGHRTRTQTSRPGVQRITHKAPASISAHS